MEPHWDRNAKKSGEVLWRAQSHGAVEAGKAACRMLEGSLQKQHTPRTVPDSGAALPGGAERNSHLGVPGILPHLELHIPLLRCTDFSTVLWEHPEVLLVLVCWVWVGTEELEERF